jgi:lipoic acid synthetase
MRKLRDVARLGVDTVTLGQCLASSNQHPPIERYVHPSELVELEHYARDQGITPSSPVRSCAPAATPTARPGSSATYAPPRGLAPVA